LEQLLDVYDAALAEALELMPGARGVLAAARQAGLSVMVVSEGRTTRRKLRSSGWASRPASTCS
jgi:beta-phosphoglucomutase-like phosphatase (HAD superfamily)